MTFLLSRNCGEDHASPQKSSCRPPDRFEGTWPERGLCRDAAALGDQFPGVSLIIHSRCPGTGRPRAGGAVILAFESNAEAFFQGCLLGCSRTLIGGDCSGNGAEDR